MKMTNLGIAAAAEIVNDTLRIDSLPDDTTAPNKFDDWRASVQRLLEEIEKHKPNYKRINRLKLKHANHGSPQWLSPPISLSRNADNFRVDVLVAERKKNETEEAKSAQIEPLNTLKASLVNKIMRVISDSLVTTAKPSPRRRQGQEKEQDQVPPSTVRTEAEDPEQAPSGGGSMTSRSHVYDALQDSLKMPLSNAGLTTLRSGRCKPAHGSSLGLRIAFGLDKGAGIRPTHNYEETCNDIATLSRVVVLGYRFYGTYMTPLTTTLPESGNHVPTYFFIHSDHLILSLDAICPNPFMNDSRLHIGHGFFMEKPSAGFQKCWDKLLKHQQELLGAVSCLVRRSSSRAKHTLEPDSDEEEAPSRKRARM
ncbi:hypothetical protein BC834DRAFT_846068 [Gloeopeniophorella convolvens]|nr:hypothetical protein BC834DRAFT_846068 [Gloeopeniophorella convolvens]